jgi:hypothetical protein
MVESVGKRRHVQWVVIIQEAERGKEVRVRLQKKKLLTVVLPCAGGGAAAAASQLARLRRRDRANRETEVELDSSRRFFVCLLSGGQSELVKQARRGG